MQAGSVERHGNGWRGRWWEDGRRRSTRVVERKGEARRLLQLELLRLEHPEQYRPLVSFGELCDRFFAVYQAAPGTVAKNRTLLGLALAEWRDVPAGDLSGEVISRWLAQRGRKASYRHGLMMVLRQVYSFGQRNRLVDHNPALDVRVPKPRRSDALRPFESWSEVERLAAELGRWGPMVIFAVDSGARPGEVTALEHKHIDGNRVYLPGTKTERSRRVVHLTDRGVEALRSFPRAIATPLVFHNHGQPLVWHHWRKSYWHAALDLAGLDRRSPYQLRHTFAYWSLRAGVPISTLAREMGHASVNLTFATYGHWADELGEHAASLRASWGRRESQEASRWD